MTSNTDLFDLYASLRRSIALEANDVFRDIGLGTRQFIILWNLNRQERMSVSELVDCAMTDASTVSRSLAQLEKNGYVEKVQCKKDGRVWYVKLSAKGASLAPEMTNLYRELAQRCFATLKAPEREQLSGLLGQVVNNLETRARSKHELSAEA